MKWLYGIGKEELGEMKPMDLSNALREARELIKLQTQK